MPKTRIGIRAIWFIYSFFLLFAVFQFLVMSGQWGGEAAILEHVGKPAFGY